MLIPLLLALCGDPTNTVHPLPPRSERTTNAPPIVLQSTNAPVAPAPTRIPVYILPDVWAVETAPGVIFVRIPDHNFQDLARLFPKSTYHVTNVTVWKEVP